MTVTPRPETRSGAVAGLSTVAGPSSPASDADALIAVGKLFDAHVDSVFTVAHRIVWNRADAEDVVQTTFLKAFGRLAQLRDQKRTRPWLLQIGYREAVAVLRRRRDVPTDPDAFPDRSSSRGNPGQEAEAADLRRRLVAAMASLPGTVRGAFVLRDVEELSMREVAGVLDISGSAAKMRVHRARAEMRRLLWEEVAGGV